MIQMRIYTDEQLQEIEEKGVICPICNKKSMDEQNGYKVRKDHCFSCNYWTDVLEDKDLKGYIKLIIDGHAYRTPEEDINQPNHRNYSGFGGRKFMIHLTKEQKGIPFYFFTCNLWHQGAIPEHFKDKIPDNAEFVNDHKWQNINGTEYISSDK